MATTRQHPKNNKKCVFCNYWTGDANMKFINTSVGFEYEASAVGKCMKCNANRQTYSNCTKFEPSIEARKLL